MITVLHNICMGMHVSDIDFFFGGGGVRYWDLPVGPWYVDELLPPPADHHCDVESQHKAHRYQAGEVVAMEDYALKYSASNKNHQHSPIWT